MNTQLSTTSPQKKPRIPKCDNVAPTSTIRVQFNARNNFLLRYREQKGLTQFEMARMCGISVIRYGPAERFGQASFATMTAISTVLELPMETVFPTWAYKFGEMLNDNQAYLLLSDTVGQAVVNAKQDICFLTTHTDADLDYKLQMIFKQLPSRTYDILIHRLGLFSAEKMTFRALAIKHNIGIPRVSQIYSAGIKLLRTTAYQEMLSEYRDLVSEYQQSNEISLYTQIDEEVTDEDAGIV